MHVGASQRYARSSTRTPRNPQTIKMVPALTGAERCSVGDMCSNDARTFQAHRFHLFMLQQLRQCLKLPLKSPMLMSLTASLSNDRTSNPATMNVKTCTAANHSLQHTLHPLPDSAAPRPRHREGLSGRPCVTLAGKQGFLPYVLSQRDVTPGGTCRKA